MHHGPLLNVAGVIGEVRDPRPDTSAYRDFKYFYGFYAISPRIVRSTPLQVWVEATDFEGTDTLVTLRLDSFVRRPFVPLWEHSQRIFWPRFPVWMKKELSV